MEAAQAYPDVCGGESRSYIKMEGTLSDYESIWKELQARPQKASGGGYRVFTNEEEWIIWLQFKRIPQKALGRSLHTATDKLALEYKRLKEQNGPKGKRPEWMV
jgi:hypothetical protein